MPDSKTATLTARENQRQASKRASKDLLRGKRRREREVPLTINGETTTVLMRAISQKELDAIREKCPPTQKQRANGSAVNPEKFPQMLVQACLADPEMDLEEVNEMWASDEWSEGELNSLFNAASTLCMEGLDVPFTGSD